MGLIELIVGYLHNASYAAIYPPAPLGACGSGTPQSQRYQQLASDQPALLQPRNQPVEHRTQNKRKRLQPS